MREAGVYICMSYNFLPLYNCQTLLKRAYLTKENVHFSLAWGHFSGYSLPAADEWQVRLGRGGGVISRRVYNPAVLSKLPPRSKFQERVMHRFARKHLNEPLLVLATGPSAWEYVKMPEFIELASNMKVIAVNRAFDMGVPVQYQISLDRIWLALRQRLKEARASYEMVVAAYYKFKAKHGPEVASWTVEDFFEAYKDILKPHTETKLYFRLCSPHAPFIRFINSKNFRVAPYSCIPFPIHAGATVKWGAWMGKLFAKGNTTQSAIHLAAIMGGKPIFVVGLDLTPPDPVNKPWEKGARYERTHDVAAGFKIIGAALAKHVPVYNLSPISRSEGFRKVKSYEEGLRLLRRHVHVVKSP